MGYKFNLYNDHKIVVRYQAYFLKKELVQEGGASKTIVVKEVEYEARNPYVNFLFKKHLPWHSHCDNQVKSLMHQRDMVMSQGIDKSCLLWEIIIMEMILLHMIK